MATNQVGRRFIPIECAKLIERAEHQGYTEAFIHGPTGKEILRKDIRNCGRCIIDDDELADTWFQRVMEAFGGTDINEKFITAWPASSSKNDSGSEEQSLRILGINERLRFLRYLEGQYFGVHQDNSYTRGPEYGSRAGEKSYLTFLLYLNDNMKGGHTRIECGGRCVDVVPKTGSVLVFDHDIYHEACKVVSGVKYCCRTDFMYTCG